MLYKLLFQIFPKMTFWHHILYILYITTSYVATQRIQAVIRFEVWANHIKVLGIF